MNKITKEYLNSLDKRTNLYKEAKKAYDSQNSPEGLGDIIEKVTEATGIKKLVKWIAGEDCGCDKRKEAMNKKFPLRSKKPNCLNEDEYKWLYLYYKQRNGSEISPADMRKLTDIFNRVFDQKKAYSTCGSCIDSRRKELRKVFEAYEQSEQN